MQTSISQISLRMIRSLAQSKILTVGHDDTTPACCVLSDGGRINLPIRNPGLKGGAMITRALILSVIMTIFLLVLFGCQAENQAATPTEVGASATAMMAAADGSPIGTVTLTQGQNGVLVSADLTGLSPGWHGFHIHSVGSCSPDFSAAGGHLTVEGQGHGFMQGEFHTGDMPNIHAAGDGTARADVFNTRASFSGEAGKAIFDADGSAIIVHAKPDSYGEDPAAGDRVACGVIERK